MANTVAGFGTDTSRWGADGKPSLGFDRPEISGVRVPLEHCACVLTTPQVTGLFYDRTIGVSRPLQTLRNSTPDDTELAGIAAEWGQACAAQVQGVKSARFTLRRGADGKTVMFAATIYTEVGVFPLNGSAGDAAVVLFPKVLP